jgi:hypothetical protein
MEIKNRRTIFMKGKRERNIRRRREKIIPEKFGPGEKNLSKIDIKELFSDVNTIFKTNHLCVYFLYLGCH